LASIYLNHNVARETAGWLRTHGHDVVSARDLHAERATDSQHLLAAAQLHRVLVTYNAADFARLHDAWRRWFSAYLPQRLPEHAGILIVPQPDCRRGAWLPDHAAREINDFLAQGLPLPNRLYVWMASRGWVER
jgi:hypothetical protein